MKAHDEFAAPPAVWNALLVALLILLAGLLYEFGQAMAGGLSP